MNIVVIGGANVDITAGTFAKFVPGDSNPGSVRISMGGVARNIAHNLALLGDRVTLLTIFGGGEFGALARADCERIGLDISLSGAALSDANSCFLSINDADGEMIGGVADMAAVEGITPSWLNERINTVNAADVIVADANLSTESLAWLIANCRKPLYLDAVSGAKAVRLRDALILSQGRVNAVKCNRLESAILRDAPGIGRRYISLGADGLRIEEGERSEVFPPLPCRVVNVTGGGDALFAGIIHSGPDADIESAAKAGLLCAKCAVESPDAVSNEISNLKI